LSYLDRIKAAIEPNNGVKLQSPDWLNVRSQLVDPEDYRFTQAIGAEMREAGVEAFQFISARAVQVGIRSLDDQPTEGGLQNLATDYVGINWGLFEPSAFQKTQPSNPRPMIVITTKENVSVVMTETDGSSTALEFPVTHFMVSGRIPRPAS